MEDLDEKVLRFLAWTFFAIRYFIKIFKKEKKKSYEYQISNVSEISISLIISLILNCYFLDSSFRPLMSVKS